jgi:hypothetical protein
MTHLSSYLRRRSLLRSRLWCLRGQRLRTPLLRSPSNSRVMMMKVTMMRSTLPCSKSKKLYRGINERESYGVEVSVPVSRLQALLVYLGITTTPKYRIKGVSRPGQVEYRSIAEIFSGCRVINRHQGPAFRASSNDDVVDAV